MRRDAMQTIFAIASDEIEAFRGLRIDEKRQV